MTTVEFLTYLRSLNIRIRAENGQLRFTAPEGALTDELRQELRARKEELLTFLQATHPASQTIEPTSRDQALPLSFGQQRLWFVQQMRPERAAYNIPLATRITGPLDVTALTRAISHVIERHEALRTTLTFQGGQLVQHVIPAETAQTYELPLVECQLETLPASATDLAWQPFDLMENSLLRTTLYRISPHEHVLLLVFHHAIFDGWSETVLFDEIQAGYEAYTEAAEIGPTLPDLPIQYADYSQWEQEQFAKMGEAASNYWEQHLVGELPKLQLPTDNQRPAVQDFVGKTQTFTLSAALLTSLKQLSQQHQTTLFMTLMAAFNTLLHRYSGQDDILVGFPQATRERDEVKNLIGFFVNTLVLRTDLSDNPPFIELLTHVREQTLEAYANQSMPFDKLVRALQKKPDLSRQPIFQVMFALQNTPPAHLSLPGLETAPFKLDNPTAKFDLTLEMFESGSELKGRFEYNTDLFNDDTIARLISHWQLLLEGIIADPTQKIALLPLLPAAEKQQLLVEWNDTATDYPHDQCFHELIEAQTARTPHALAVKVINGQTELTYQQLDERANQLAHYLRQQGVTAETLVAICVHRSLDMVIGLLGVLKAGGAYLPIDPTYPQERIAFMLSDSQAPLLLTQTSLMESLPHHQAKAIRLDDDWADIAPCPTTPLERITTADNLAYIIYTSGSTGQPKGAMIEHRGVVNYLSWAAQAYPVEKGNGSPVHSSISFDLTITSLFLPLIVGQTVLLLPKDKYSETLTSLPEQHGQLSTVKITPAHLELIGQVLPFSKAKDWAEGLVIGGEALLDEHVAFWREHAPQTRLFNEYGPTEAVVGCCVYELPATPIERPTTPIGRPIANTQLYNLDQHLQPMPIGVPGELYIGGDGVARGYINRPELTAERFVADPFRPEAGNKLYKTGDLVRYLPDGNLEFLGRIDHQIKLRGYRIELGEIEAALNQHAAVQQAVVLLREDVPGNKRLVAYVVFEETPMPTEQLRADLRQRLPDYMLPTIFMPLAQLPLTINGKINRQALPAPDTARPELSKHYIRPRNPVEKLLANSWASVLELDRVGIRDDFFELGGHSLQITQLVFYIRQLFQVELPLHTFFKVSTVAELADFIHTIRREQNIKHKDGAVINLETEAVLDESIQVPSSYSSPLTPMKKIFLTGVTGFVGAFLAAELLQQTEADIYCLVRSGNNTDSLQRIRQHFQNCSLPLENLQQRVKVVIGDLSQPHLGLSSEEFECLATEMDVIYHCGADVNLIYPYDELKLSNVLGTQEIFRLATAIRTTPVHYISTFAVFSSVGYFKGQLIYENETISHSDTLFNGYSQSKWVAEKIAAIARTRNIPVAIYRLGYVVGDSKTGTWKAENYLTQYLKNCLYLGSMPEFDQIIQMTPVDYISQAITHLSQKPSSLNQVFHVLTPHYISTQNLADMFDTLGYPMRLIPYATWQAELIDYTLADDNHPLNSLLPLFYEPVLGKDDVTIPEMYKRGRQPTYDRHNVEAGLSDTKLICPPIDTDLFSKYLAYFTKIGFLDSSLIKANKSNVISN